MGDQERARQEVETALSIDPDFLAARVLQDQLKTPETSTVPPAPEVFQPPASLAASAAKLAQIEERVKQRVHARETAQPAPRTLSAVPRKPPAVAPSRTARQWRAGAVAAAGVAFAVAIGSNTRVRGPQSLYSHATVTATPLIEAAMPLPIDVLTPDDEPPVVERFVPPPARVAQPLPVRVTLTPPAAPVQQPPPFGFAQGAPGASRGPQTIATPMPVQAAPVNSVVTDSPPPAVMPRAVDERALVEETLARYRRAYNRLDAQSAKEVYPGVNAPALSRAFDGLQSQSLQFDECDIDVRGVLASVTCRGTSRYVPKIGSRDPQVEPRVWDFTLRKDTGDWKIENARAGR